MTTEIEAMAARIVELETRLAFQDDTIEELNGVLVSQQQQIDRLENDFELIRKRLKQLLTGTDCDHGC